MFICVIAHNVIRWFDRQLHAGDCDFNIIIATMHCIIYSADVFIIIPICYMRNVYPILSICPSSWKYADLLCTDMNEDTLK